MNIKGRRAIDRVSLTPTPTNVNAGQMRQRSDACDPSQLHDPNVTEEEDEEEEEDYDNAANQETTEDAFTKDSPRTPEMSQPPIWNIPPNRKVPRYSPESDVIAKTSRVGCYGLIVAVVAVCLGLVWYLAPSVDIPLADATERKCTYDSLQRSNPEQDIKVWKSLSAGIEDILNNRSRSPGVYLFLHQGGDSVQSLVKEIASASSKCFGHKMSPVEMQPTDFTSPDTIKDYGHAIDKYKRKMKDGHVILIANLNEIPAEAAPALHTICDTYSPIFKDVIIFLTLSTDDSEGSAVKRAQDKLFDLWSPKIERNELDPLITRVTDQVIALKS